MAICMAKGNFLCARREHANVTRKANNTKLQIMHTYYMYSKRQSTTMTSYMDTMMG